MTQRRGPGLRQQGIAVVAEGDGLSVDGVGCRPEVGVVGPLLRLELVGTDDLDDPRRGIELEIIGLPPLAELEQRLLERVDQILLDRSRHLEQLFEGIRTGDLLRFGHRHDVSDAREVVHPLFLLTHEGRDPRWHVVLAWLDRIHDGTALLEGRGRSYTGHPRVHRLSPGPTDELIVVNRGWIEPRGRRILHPSHQGDDPALHGPNIAHE